EGFGALILSNGRADKVATLDTLRKHGYSGPIRFLLDSEDETVGLYREKFGAENVVVFDKVKAAENVDVMDNAGTLRGVVYARNASFEVAKELGWTHFIMLDDDYIDWRWCFGSDRRYHHPTVVSLDRIFDSLVRFLDSTPALTICLSQAGDLIGGQDSGNLETIDLGTRGKRKAMNTFVCRVDRPIRFSGRINEDVNAYIFLGAVGGLFFTTNYARVTQYQTQTNTGGLTELYRDSGTYVKSFFTVLGAPSCVKVAPLISKFPRWHHRVSWRNAVPKILREEVRRPR
ncbi:MAG: hypothetical protein ABL984_00250, partial [Pyrinomonadaceae bacterium]